MIRTLADLNDAYTAGMAHSQRVLKNAGASHTTQWADPTFASGQPPYDAHVGTPLQFMPCVAQKNDAVYFPTIASGQTRHLHTLTLWSNQATFNGPGSVVIYDLLGYYPLIDGDSTDTQEMDNTLTLPRYADGDGVFAVWVNHVAPAIANGMATVLYTNSDGVQQSVTVNVPNVGVNLVATGGVQGSASAVSGALAMPLASGAKGVRSIDAVTYMTPPSGLHCIYLVKVLGTMTLGDNLVTAEKDFFIHNGCNMPRIHDGAWLGWFDNIGAGTARSVAWFGQFGFVWG